MLLRYSYPLYNTQSVSLNQQHMTVVKGLWNQQT